MKYALPFVLMLASFSTFFTSVSAESISFDDGRTWNCDQSFTPVVLRYGYYQGFFDTFRNTNTSTYTNYINTFDVNYKNANYLSAGGPFAFTQDIRNANYAIGPNQSMRIIATGDNNWRVVRHPAVRTTGSNYDFLIGYKIDYDTSNNYPDASDDLSHIECQPYQVSWCGDGVVDAMYSETCDDGANNGLPSKCNSSCTGVNPPESNVCDQTFPSVTLRYGNMHNFYDTYSNLDSFAHRLRTFAVSFEEPYDYNASAEVPNFDWTTAIKSANYIVPSGTTGLRAIESTNNYTIRAVPLVRKSDNLTIKYKIFTENVNGGEAISHTECQPYAISWCGDGILDTQFGEPCDPAAEPWKTNGTCRVNPTDGTKCEVVTPPPPPPATPYSACTPGVPTADCSMRTYVDNAACLAANPAGSGRTCYLNDVVSCNAARATQCPVVPPPPPPATPYSACIPGNPAADCATNTYATQAACLLANPGASGRTCYLNNIVACNTTRAAQCPVIVPPISGFDLSLKKYIGVNDAQAAPGVSTNTNAVLNYIIRVTNSALSTNPTSGTTTVQDILPAGVEYDTAATGSGWICAAVVGRTLRCTSAQVIAPGASYPDITVPIRVTATAGQSVANIAAVDNPAETSRCTATGTLPITDTGVCTLDATNSDPAVLSIPGTGPGGTSNIGKKCINGLPSCATYNSIIACEADVGVGNCDSSDAPGRARCEAKSLICTGPGGGGCTGPTCYVDGFCGDGVLGSSLGEECDEVGAEWCVACKIRGLTNPGANPITDLWMTIPVLSRTNRVRLGYSWLNNDEGKVAFADNRMVLGVGTKAFTLADTIGFGIQTRYTIPIILEATKKMCLTSSGTAINSETLCTTIGDGANISISSGIETWTRYDGVEFVNIGRGEYQVPVDPRTRPMNPGSPPTNPTLRAAYDVALQAWYDWKPYRFVRSNSANNITLFKGATQYSTLGSPSSIGPTLNSAFFGMRTGDDAIIQLFSCSGTDCSATARADLVALSVKVSGAVVSSIGSSANRSLQSFINPGNPFAGFMTTTSGDTSTTTNNAVTTPAPVVLPTIVGGASGSVSSVAEIERYAVNGNKNVLAVNGDLTVLCPVGRSVFEMEGVRTVIVTGDLIIRCNIIYTSSDTTSSWAWITKGGNIKVSNGLGTLSAGAITNMAGVFVSVKDGTTGGDITYIDNATTQAILRVEGSMYGNATTLFSSRLYARATGAYDILTTGTIINYSNRALVNPPPLLSQYLGNYQVERVIQ